MEFTIFLKIFSPAPGLCAQCPYRDIGMGVLSPSSKWLVYCSCVRIVVVWGKYEILGTTRSIRISKRAIQEDCV